MYPKCAFGHFLFHISGLSMGWVCKFNECNSKTLAPSKRCSRSPVVPKNWWVKFCSLKIARTWMSYDGKRKVSATYSWSRILPRTLGFLNFPLMKKKKKKFYFIEIDINHYFIFMKGTLNLVAQNFPGSICNTQKCENFLFLTSSKGPYIKTWKAQLCTLAKVSESSQDQRKIWVFSQPNLSWK